MRGEIGYKILDFLEDRSMATVDFFAGFLAAGYGASLSKMEYQHSIRGQARHSYQIDRQKRRSLQKYMYKLKSQGLLAENSHGAITLSSKGKKKLSVLRKYKIIDPQKYKKETSSKITIISYDIPVAFNRERDRVREVLKLLGFQMVHKSVWIGKVKLPPELIHDFQIMGILKFIEILEVTKIGSLKSVS